MLALAARGGSSVLLLHDSHPFRLRPPRWSDAVAMAGFMSDEDVESEVRLVLAQKGGVAVA